MLSHRLSKVDGHLPISPCLLRGLECVRGTVRVQHSPALRRKAEGGCPQHERGRLPRDVQQEPDDCSLRCGLEDLLGKVPLLSWGTKLFYAVLGVVWGCSISSLPRLQVPLFAYGSRCLSIRLCGAPIPDRRCHLNPAQWEICCVPTQPSVAAHCLAVPSVDQVPARTRGQPCSNLALGSLLHCIVEHKCVNR